MPEPRLDMLPDPSLTDQEGVQTLQTPVATVIIEEPVQQEAPAGSKTPEPNFFAALKEERIKRKELEQKVKELESSITIPSGDMSDEGRVLQAKIDSLEEKIQLGEVINKFPVLKDKQSEFDEFRTEYPRTKLENVAKLFLAENNLLEASPDRKGLERPTGGEKTTPTTKYSSEDIDRMMKNDNRRFQRLVKEGKIRPEDIEPDIK